jgi:hypothetical protein
MMKQSRSKFMQSSRGNNLMKSKDITNMSLQEVLTKKNLHQPQKQVYKSPRMHGTTGKKAVDSHSPPLAKA